MLKPHALAPGARIGVVAPASPFTREEFDAGIAELRRLGFEPAYDESVFERRAYVAGEPERRAAALRRAWCDPSIAGVIGVRGGYGSAQLLPLLDTAEAKRARKPLIGYSDLTSLLTFLTLKCGVVAFHGPMLAGRLARGPAAFDPQSLLAAVTRCEPMGEISAPGMESLRPGEASGPIFGGTMTQLLASLSTPFAFDPPARCVLFLEEIRERPYKLDRMLTQFAQAGLLERAAAIVIGELPQCDEPGGEPSGRGVVADMLRDFRGPVIVGFPSGHTAGPALTLPLGVRVRVVAGRTPKVVIEEAAVV